MQKQIFSGTPVVSARKWTNALVPNVRGGFNHISQSVTHEGTGANQVQHVDWIVTDIPTGVSTPGPINIAQDEGAFYTHVGLGIDNQLLAPNGNCFFPGACNHIAVYDHLTESVTQLPQVRENGPDGNPILGIPQDLTFYTHVFTHDGKKLYCGTSSKSLPLICEIDTKTNATRVIRRVGTRVKRKGYSFAYSLQIDLPWVYVAVGKNPWELCALNVSTGEMKILKTIPSTGTMVVKPMPGDNPQGIVAEFVTKNRAGSVRDSWWCIDGAITKDVPSKPRKVNPYKRELVNPPDIDNRMDFGSFKWKQPPSKIWTTVEYPSPHPTPVAIESMLRLPDGSVLGNAKGYRGFFKLTYKPETRKWSTKSFGPWGGMPDKNAKGGLSRGPRMIVKGTIWMAGYPNGKLYSYNPNQPWSPWDPPVNPTQHQNFSKSKMKYADLFAYSETRDRLYCLGRREREGVGTAIGRFDLQDDTFDGHPIVPDNINPVGLVVTEKPQELSCVVVSTKPRTHGTEEEPPTEEELDGSMVDESPTAEDVNSQVQATEGQLIIYNLDLVEQGREYVQIGTTRLISTGFLFKTNTPNVIVGLSQTEKEGSEAQRVLYRYNIKERKVIKSVIFDKPLEAQWQHPDSTEAYAVMRGVLCHIDLVNLTLREMALLIADRFMVYGDTIFSSKGATLAVHQLS